MLPLIAALIIATFQLCVAVLSFITSRKNAAVLRSIEVNVNGRLSELIASRTTRSLSAPAAQLEKE